MPLTVYLETLGCPRNEVDSELAASVLRRSGCVFTPDPEGADVLIVNTCSFIQDARREAYERIGELSVVKSMYPKRKLIVMGCLPELWADRGRRLFPAVDSWLGTGGWRTVGELVDGFDPETGQATRTHRMDPWYAYLRVSVGCDRACSYCLIPTIRGSLKMRGRRELLREAESLAEQGVRELILVAQDTTRCTGPGGLPGLLADLAREAMFPWIRILYAHPAGVDEELAEALALNPGVLPYVDMPIQHASRRILRRMGRWPDPADLERKVELLRRRVPSVVLRTTVMVGFPGETEEDVRSLMDFLQATQFRHVGVFSFSREVGTPAFGFKRRVRRSEGEARRHRIEVFQTKVRRAQLAALTGSTVESVVEKELPSGERQCRPWWSAPGVDGCIVATGEARVGERVMCRIEGVGGGAETVGSICKVT
jgi:ribosomal protein S12 methylthiotransferase